MTCMWSGFIPVLPVFPFGNRKGSKEGGYEEINFLPPPMLYCASMCFYCVLPWQEMLEISYFLLVNSSSFRADLRKRSPVTYIQHRGICSTENKIIIFQKKQNHILFAKWELKFVGNKWKFIIFTAKKWKTLMNLEVRQMYFYHRNCSVLDSGVQLLIIMQI